MTLATRLEKEMGKLPDAGSYKELRERHEKLRLVERSELQKLKDAMRMPSTRMKDIDEKSRAMIGLAEKATQYSLAANEFMELVVNKNLVPEGYFFSKEVLETCAGFERAAEDHAQRSDNALDEHYRNMVNNGFSADVESAVSELENSVGVALELGRTFGKGVGFADSYMAMEEDRMRLGQELELFLYKYGEGDASLRFRDYGIGSDFVRECDKALFLKGVVYGNQISSELRRMNRSVTDAVRASDELLRAYDSGTLESGLDDKREGIHEAIGEINSDFPLFCGDRLERLHSSKEMYEEKQDRISKDLRLGEIGKEYECLIAEADVLQDVDELCTKIPEMKKRLDYLDKEMAGLGAGKHESHEAMYGLLERKLDHAMSLKLKKREIDFAAKSVSLMPLSDLDKVDANRYSGEDNPYLEESVDAYENAVLSRQEDLAMQEAQRLKALEEREEGIARAKADALKSQADESYARMGGVVHSVQYDFLKGLNALDPPASIAMFSAYQMITGMAGIGKWEERLEKVNDKLDGLFLEKPDDIRFAEELGRMLDESGKAGYMCDLVNDGFLKKDTLDSTVSNLYALADTHQ